MWTLKRKKKTNSQKESRKWLPEAQGLGLSETEEIEKDW